MIVGTRIQEQFLKYFLDSCLNLSYILCLTFSFHHSFLSFMHLGNIDLSTRHILTMAFVNIMRFSFSPCMCIWYSGFLPCENPGARMLLTGLHPPFAVLCPTRQRAFAFVHSNSHSVPGVCRSTIGFGCLL